MKKKLKPIEIVDEKLGISSDEKAEDEKEKSTELDRDEIISLVHYFMGELHQDLENLRALADELRGLALDLSMGSEKDFDQCRKVYAYRNVRPHLTKAARKLENLVTLENFDDIDEDTGDPNPGQLIAALIDIARAGKELVLVSEDGDQ